MATRWQMARAVVSGGAMQASPTAALSALAVTNSLAPVSWPVLIGDNTSGDKKPENSGAPSTTSCTQQQSMCGADDTRTPALGSRRANDSLLDLELVPLASSAALSAMRQVRGARSTLGAGAFGGMLAAPAPVLQAPPPSAAWSLLLMFALPLPRPRTAGAAAPPPPPGVTAVPASAVALRGISASAPSILQELQNCATVQEVQDVVDRHRGLMRPMHFAEVVQRLGLLTFGSRNDSRAAARRLAAECTAAALKTGAVGSGGGSRRPEVGMDVLTVLVRGWGWVRKPPPELLVKMLEALVPGSSEGIAAGAGGGEGGGAVSPLPLAPQASAAVRQGYGRLHTAKLRDAAELVEPLAAVDALTPPLLEVLINVAVRRASNEAPAAVAAAAVAYGRAGIADQRVAEAFLKAAVARRSSSGGSAAAAAAATAGQVAEALGLCAKAGWYDPRVFAEAAEALLARSVGDLTLRQIWSVLRAFAGARHEHPLLLTALATHAKTFDFTFSRAKRGTHGAAADATGWWAPLAAAAAADGAVEAGSSARVSALADVSSRSSRELTKELSTLAGLVYGFSTAQVCDKELYDRLAGAAAALLREAMATAGLGGPTAAAPRPLVAALTALLEGFAAAGAYPWPLLEAMTSQRPYPSWARSVSVEQLLSLSRAFAAFRFRDEALLERLDAAAAVFVENAVSAAAAAAPTPPDVSWLPAFLDAACRQLSYPCPRTVVALTSAVTVVRKRTSGGDGDGGGGGLRPLSEEERRSLNRPTESSFLSSLSDAGAGMGKAGAVLQLQRLQLLLLLAFDDRVGGGGAAGSGSGGGPRWLCELLSGLACSGACLRVEVERDLAWALSRSIKRAVGSAPEEAEAATPAGLSPPAGGVGVHKSAAAAPWHDAASHGSAALRPPPPRRLTAAQTAAALDDEAACHLFRAIIASQYRWEGREAPGREEDQHEEDEGGGGGGAAGVARGGLEAAVHRELSPPLAAALLARAAAAWHATAMGAAMPRPLPAAPAAVAASLPPQMRLRRGAAFDAAQSPLLSDLLRSLGLPVFEQWETSDGFFRVARGVVLPGGRKVAVEVLPDEAFAAASGGGSLGRNPGSNLVGDAAFRARCLAGRGWRLVALPAGEWAAAEAAGPAACMVLLRRHSGAL